MTWELAPSLAACRAEANRIAPNRSKASDGTIGDAAHQARTSDHNVGARNRVHALDLTHDPAGGFDAHAYVDRLRVSQDRRVRYIISRSRIAGPGTSHGGWQWHPYNGSSPHDHHAHISIHSTVAAETDTRPWWPAVDKPSPTPTPPAYGFTSTMNGVRVRQFTVRIPTDPAGEGSAPGVCPLDKFIAATASAPHDKYGGTKDQDTIVAKVGWRDDGGQIRLTAQDGPPSAEVLAWVTVAD
jgi:hypothetical protein